MKIIIFMLISIICFASEPSSKLEGKWIWEKNSTNHTFTILIKKVKNKFIGQYCSIAQAGRRIDCFTKEDISFEFENKHKNEYITNFITSYSHKEGTIKIILEENALKWKIIKFPNGEYYCPNEAILKKVI